MAETIEVNGEVTETRHEDKVSRAGKPFKIYYATVDGVEINTGYNAKKVGEKVNAVLRKNYGQWQIDATAKPTGKSTATTAKGAGSMGKTFPLEITHADNTIVRQNALAHATKIVTTVETAFDGILDETREDAINRMTQEVQRVADELWVYSTGQSLVKEALE